MQKKLVLIFCIIVLLKLCFVPFIQVPLGHSDSLSYLEDAKLFFEKSFSSIAEHSKYPPLYSAVISPSFIFNNMNLVFSIILIINIFISTSIIIPINILLKRFLKNTNERILLTGLIALIPSFFALNYYIFSENLYLVLFTWTTLFIFQAFFSKRQIVYSILAGLGAALLLLTKINAIIFIILIPLILIYSYIQRKKIPLKQMLIPISLSLFYTPWLILKGNSTFNSSNILGYGSEINHALNPSFFYSKFIWSLLYLDYLILALGIIFFLGTMYIVKNWRKISMELRFLVIYTFLSTLLLIAIASNTSGAVSHFYEHRIIGRYIIPVIPLFIIIGFIGLKHFRTNSKKINLCTFLFVLITTPFMLYNTFFPSNNSDLILIGISKLILEILTIPYTVIIMVFITIIFLILLKTKRKTLLYGFLIFFLTMSLLNSIAIVYDSQERWLPLEEVKLGFWINENIEKDAKFMINREDIPEYKRELGDPWREDIDRPISVVGYWIRGIYYYDYTENVEEYDYVITEEEMNLKLIKEEGKIKVYEV